MHWRQDTEVGAGGGRRLGKHMHEVGLALWGWREQCILVVEAVGMSVTTPPPGKFLERDDLSQRLGQG